MLSVNKGRRIEKYIQDYVIFDLETTGISPVSDEVVEISAIKVKQGNVIEEFTSLINPQCPIPHEASRINGITDDMVQDAPLFSDELEKFCTFTAHDVLVGHNIHSFDMRFLYRDAKKFYKRTLDNDYIDTLLMARQLLPQLMHHRLTDLADYYGISSQGAHRALNDCHMNQQVFKRLAKEMVHASQNHQRVKICPRCGSVMRMRSGRYGEFWGCSGYPKCKYTENSR